MAQHISVSAHLWPLPLGRQVAMTATSHSQTDANMHWPPRLVLWGGHHKVCPGTLTQETKSQIRVLPYLL